MQCIMQLLPLLDVGQIICAAVDSTDSTSSSHCCSEQTITFHDAGNITLSASGYYGFEDSNLYLSSSESFVDKGTFTAICGGYKSCSYWNVEFTHYLSRYSLHCILFKIQRLYEITYIKSIHSVSVQCTERYACWNANISCPETTNCSVYCDPDSTNVCDGADVFISDTDGLYDDSLLSISCESGDCMMFIHQCTDIEVLTSCTRSTVVESEPLDCSTATDHCQVWFIYVVCTCVFRAQTI